MSLLSKIAAAAAIAVVSAGVALGAAAETTVRMATTGPEAEGDPNTLAMHAFRDFIEFASKGEMKVELIWGGALGGDRELMELVQANQLQVVMVSLGPVAGFFPEIQVFSLPYLFDSSVFATNFLNTSDYAAALSGRLEAATGFKVLGYADGGFRDLTNNVRPIRTPADMEGLKIRTMESPVFMRMMEAMGAAATPMAFTELILALKQGVVDGQENAPSTVLNFGIAEVQKYMSLDDHTYDAAITLSSHIFFDGLAPGERQIFLDGALLMIAVLNAEIPRNVVSDVEKIREMGVEVYVNSAAEKAMFREAALGPVSEFIAEQIGQEAIDGLLAALKAHKKLLYGIE